MKLKIFIGSISIVLVAFIALSQTRREAFVAAEDFPRGALVYVQIADLPACVRLWNESKFKAEYLESENFKSLKNRHLGLKLASRWEEFNQASGFPIDAETLIELADGSAALAVYDIGKLEFVFVAPLADEIFALSKFARHQDKFAEETLGDGTRIYRAAVAADRGRQKQELIFANANGRFILATGEKLFAQTLNNINEKAGENRLADEPAFKILSQQTAPHAATVWVNQTALNQDYYFKRYWLMSEIGALENIRAGMFDLAFESGKLIERRRFFLDQMINQPPIESAQAGRMLALAPADVPFYQLRTANDKTVDEAIRATIFDRRTPAENKAQLHHSFYDADDFQAGDYERLNEKFDEMIDETEDNETLEKRETVADFSAFLHAAKPQTVLTFTAPEPAAAAALFVEFRRAAIFALGASVNFDRDSFEAAIAEKISAQVMISAASVKLNWATNGENGAAWRELKLPMLGREIVYARRGDALILTNSVELLRKIQTTRQFETGGKFDSPASKLTVLNFTERENAYDRVFAALAERRAANGFFIGNVGSLLDSLGAVQRIEISENYSRNFLEEKIIINYRQSD